MVPSLGRVLLALASIAAAEEAVQAACRVPGERGCLPPNTLGADEDGGVGLLQRGAKATDAKAEVLSRDAGSHVAPAAKANASSAAGTSLSKAAPAAKASARGAAEVNSSKAHSNDTAPVAKANASSAVQPSSSRVKARASSAGSRAARVAASRARRLAALAKLNTSMVAARRAARTRMPNGTAIWEQLKAGVQKEHLEEMMENVTDSAEVQKLEAQLKKLQDKFPSADEVKDQFIDEWEQVKDAVDMEDLQSKLEKAKEEGSAQLVELQAQLDALKAKMPEFDLDSVKERCSNVWATLEDAGANLPNLDDLQRLADQAMDTVQDAWNSVTGTVGGWFR